MIWSTIVLVLVVLIVLKTTVHLWLEFLNLKPLQAKLQSSGAQASEEDKRTLGYHQALTRHGAGEMLMETVILLGLVLFGFFPWVYHLGTQTFGSGIWADALLGVGVLFVLSLPGWPWSWRHQFGIEQAYGFNRSTKQLWWSDRIKGTVLTFVLGVPLLALVLWIQRELGTWWWLYAALGIFLIQLLMMVLYPKLILPLFNKLEPLKDQELKQRLMDLADRSGYKAESILVMDGSKRSGHSNAFFTGFGKFRKIVLFDTLIEQMEVEELEAVLAHEIGHYRLGHIPKMLAIALVGLLLTFGALAWLIQAEWIWTALGFAGTPRLVAVIWFLALFSGFFTFWITPLFSLMSRKHEFEADAFARDAMGGPQSLVSALRKLFKKNLGNPLPHPLYSAFFHSHPPLEERVGALEAKAG